MKIDLCDGKYTYILDEDTGVQEVLRYGEPWRKEDLLGDNLIFAMAQRIIELENEVSKGMGNHVEDECRHENGIVPFYDYIKCKSCYMINTDNGWGVASYKWFKDVNEAKFYRDHGRYPV
jgi:hypothetical protein